MRVAIIGGGASGMMAAGICAKNGNEVDLFEANNKLGKKIFITGKGRCNVTNCSSNENILNNVVNNSKFLYSALNAFGSYDTISFFEDLGTPIKVERGERAFPMSDKSSDIIKALTKFLSINRVNILLDNKVTHITNKENMFTIITNCGTYNNYDATICCTGGLTYSATGSTGDGYNFAKNFGHTIIDLKAGLVPILLKDTFVKNIEGLSLKNVALKAYVNKKLYKELFGEMLFTSKGISGPIVLSMSSFINRQSNVDLYIDFKPALSYEKLLARLKRDIDNNKQMQISSLLAGLLPKAFIEPFLYKLNIEKTYKVKTLNAIHLTNIITLLKQFPLTFDGLDKLDFGIITSGGVNIKEINPKTMESKLVKRLYFAGEVLDVDALTGGFNLQIAFSTGYVAGNSVK
ncbi:MAG: NAD(P)/FAD-dependent oxidoreductase [Clostridiales bacterium]|nr:NAD(P)/FAD-dependent oxidoreductase [Clostridiales bacterium]